MKVFMSWSGARSHATAELLRDWVKCVLQASQPWISSRDIDRGSLWFSEINNNLQDTSVGIVCLTHENKNKPWILFEAGALAKGLSTSRVCTFLVDLKTSDLDDPLRQFNHTLPTREGVFALVTTLNSALEVGGLDPRILQEVFNTYWPQFEGKFAAILDSIPAETVIEVRPPETMLAEILESTRALETKMRAIENRDAMNRARDRDFDAHAHPGRHTSFAGSSLMVGIAEARSLIASGKQPETAMSMLSDRGMSKDMAKQVVGLALEFPPDATLAA